ncbi:MAG: NAD(P)/FAD-dependent oxidoreductase [Scytonema sp. CRU_2_7]|nr:NAD(P)/FAD-dependent oxidoreductase [Scytonema sp. CRU_2_7]
MEINSTQLKWSQGAPFAADDEHCPPISQPIPNFVGELMAMKTTQKISDSNQFDVIVIGSGIGGLTVAAILSKLNHKKVLILEQHFIVGGFTQEFKRKGFRWDIGVQAVTEMAKGDIGRVVFDYITEGKLQWEKLPNLSDKLVYPDFTFEIYSNPQRNISDLIRMFPEEKASIKRYFSDLQKVTIWYKIHLIADFLPKWLQRLIKLCVGRLGKLARLTTKEYVERNFRNPYLKALLTSQWGAYGLPPSQISFGIHAVAMTSYGKGSWYPVGGSQAIVDCILPTIKKLEEWCLPNAMLQRLL